MRRSSSWRSFCCALGERVVGDVDGGPLLDLRAALQAASNGRSMEARWRSVTSAVSARRIIDCGFDSTASRVLLKVVSRYCHRSHRLWGRATDDEICDGELRHGACTRGPSCDRIEGLFRHSPSHCSGPRAAAQVVRLADAAGRRRLVRPDRARRGDGARGAAGICGGRLLSRSAGCSRRARAMGEGGREFRAASARSAHRGWGLWRSRPLVERGGGHGVV